LNPPRKSPGIAADAPQAKQCEIDAETAGQRLDNFLLGELKGVPRSHVYRLIRSGQVRVNSGRVTPSRRLQAGDRVRVPPVRQGAAAPVLVAAEALDWLAERIVFEDARMLVLDKPAGLAVHGGSGVSLGCIEALRRLKPECPDLELAHRLDRDTSGCLLLAKRRSTLRVLHALLREGRIEKRYFALVKGRWPEVTRQIDAPLVTRRVGGEARVKVDDSGKRAVSSFRLLDAFGQTASLLEVEIATGRTHQIRVHAAHAGHPVAGDERYGDADFNRYLQAFGLRRMFLHAHSLSFTWPDDGREFLVNLPLPDDLKAVLTALESKRESRRADRARPPSVRPPRK
jgi:23S rRNA pseudouridine955/2504/2580 synthase